MRNHIRYFKIFLLNCQEVFQERGRSFVWFLVSCINPVLMILFWKGANVSSTTLSLVSSYYFFLMIGESLLTSHSEENIALIDIQEGRLGNYILKPFSYFIEKWSEEFPYRLMQSFFGLITISCVVFFFHIKLHTFNLSLVNILLLLCSIILGISLAQVYKMALGFISFWTTDAYGIFQFSEMLIFVFAGYLVPVAFYPHALGTIAYFLPFAYMVYFPVAAMSGIISTQQMVFAILGQILWLAILIVAYKVLWHFGLKQFTGVGQ